MEKLSIYTTIRNSLHESNWNHVTSSLKWDPIVWESIQNPQIIEKLQVFNLGEIDDWSPANLGLISIDLKITSKALQKSNLPVLDDPLLDRAMKLLDGVRTDDNIYDLENSILIALAIREKLVQGEPWLSIRREFLENPLDRLQSVFVCLFGLINNPIDFLEECISIDNSLENYLLILHTVLANPIETDQQVSILTTLLTSSQNNSLPILEIYKFIQYLHLVHPVLAKRLSENLFNHRHLLIEKEHYQSNSVIDNLYNMELQLLLDELQDISNHRGITNRHINAGFDSLIDVLIDFAIRIDNSNHHQNAPQEIEEEKIFLKNKLIIKEMLTHKSLANHALLQTNSLMRLLENKQYVEAEQLISTNDTSLQSGFINNLIIAMNAFGRNDQDQSLAYAQNAITEIYANDTELISYLTNHSESVIIPFFELLIDLDLFQEAITFVRKAISLCKLDIRLLTILGEACLADFRPDEAAEAFYHARLLKPEDLNIRRRLALCLEEIGMWNEAYYERKLILDEIENSETPKDISDLHKLTECVIKLGYIDEALILTDQAILLDNENGYSYSLIGKALINNGEAEAALEQFEKGIQLSPQTPETWLSLAEAQLLVQNTKGAIETLQAAFQAIPTSAEIHLALGDLQLSQNALTEALTTFKRGAELEPNNIQLALKLGTTLQLLGHLIESEHVLESVHLRIPNHIGVANAYAKVLLQSGDKARAIPLLCIIVKSNPKSIDSFLEFSEAVLSTRAISDGLYTADEVLDILHRALEKDPSNPVAHALLGETLTLKEDYLAAKKAYQVALESNLIEGEEWFARLSLGMGRVALALGQEDVALASLQEALHADPNNSTIHMAICEVYQAVNLPENALQSARAALNLAIDDIDTLTWYADQMVLLSEMEAIQSSLLTSNDLLKQIQSEALNALYQANQIAPERADLMVKLGRIQSILGENINAVTTLNSLIDNEHANVNDFMTAGELLSGLGDTCGAITSLERAYSMMPVTSTNSSANLLINLARLYHIDGDNESAIQALNRALENNPSYAPVYASRANLLIELNDEDEALSCISEGLEKTIDNQSQIQLHLLASKVFRRRGDLKLAIDHAQEGISLCNIDAVDPDLDNSMSIGMIRLTSDLYQAILKPNRSRLLLKEMERKFKIEATEDLDYCCSYVELFLEILSDEELTSIISQLIEANPNHPRILALQAKIFKHRGDYHTSLQILHTALESTNLKIWKSKEEQKSLSPDTTLLTWYTLCDTALDLFQWDTAHYIVHQTLELAPLEPRAHLNLARLIVMRAEYQWLCEKMDVITNAPGVSAISTESRASFEQAMSNVVQYLPILEADSSYGDTKSNISRMNPTINQWNARGLAIFGDDEEAKQAVIDLAKLKDQTDGNRPQLNFDDFSALVGADIRLSTIEDDDKLNKLSQMAHAFMQDWVLPLQVALALSEKRPEETIALLNKFSEMSQPKDSSLYAMGKAFAAKLLSRHNQFESAKSAIDGALALLNNEPKWHHLAAVIYQNINNLVEAIHHFDEAIRLDPHNINNHLGLGKILIGNSEHDPASIKRAVQVLERACRIEPEDPEPWFYLSRAYLSIADIDQAATNADMAISLAPDNIDLLTLRGEIALHRNEFQTALEYADQAFQIDPHNSQAILIQSQALRELGHVNQALEVLEAAMENMEDPLTLQIEYAILLNDMRGPQASLDALQQLVEQYPDNPKVLSLLAINMSETGQTEAAIQTAQSALQASNGSQTLTARAELHYLLGSLLFRARQLDQAIYHLSESIALTPNFIESYLELGRAQQERRQYRQALEAYQKATRIAPNDPRPHFQAGIALKEGKDYQASESMLRRAAALAPDDVNIRRQLAAVVALNLVHNPRIKKDS